MKDESIGRLISILYRIGQNHMGKKLEPYGIGSGQFAFLAELYAKDGVNQEDFACRLHCDKATVSRAMQHLEQNGYVKRKKSEDDGRVNLVFLTDKALDFKKHFFEILWGWTEILAVGFSSEERELIISLLTRFVENVSTHKSGVGSRGRAENQPIGY